MKDDIASVLWLFAAAAVVYMVGWMIGKMF